MLCSSFSPISFGLPRVAHGHKQFLTTASFLFDGLIWEVFEAEDMLPGNGCSIFPLWWWTSTECPRCPWASLHKHTNFPQDVLQALPLWWVTTEIKSDLGAFPHVYLMLLQFVNGGVAPPSPVVIFLHCHQAGQVTAFIFISWCDFVTR